MPFEIVTNDITKMVAEDISHYRIKGALLWHYLMLFGRILVKM